MKKNINFLGSVQFENINKNNYQYFDNLMIENGVAKVCDSGNLSKNKYIIHTIEEIEFDGSEEWKYSKKYKSYYCIIDDKFSFEIGGYHDGMMCTHFKWQENIDGIELYKFSGGQNKEVYFNYDNGVGGLDNFIDWVKTRKKECGIALKIHFIRENPIIFIPDSYDCDPRFIPHSIEFMTNIKPTIKVQHEVNVQEKYNN